MFSLNLENRYKKLEGNLFKESKEEHGKLGAHSTASLLRNTYIKRNGDSVFLKALSCINTHALYNRGNQIQCNTSKYFYATYYDRTKEKCALLRYIYSIGHRKFIQIF